MNQRLLELATRHGALKAKIDEQRRVLSQHTKKVERAFDRADSVMDGVAWLKKNPAVVGAAIATLVVARPKRTWRWAKRGYLGWRSWQAIKQALIGSK